MAKLIHTLIHRALLDDESQPGLALVPDAPHTDHLEHEAPAIDYSFVEKIIPNGSVQTLPPLDANYPEAVKEMVREADADRLYVVPPFVDGDEVHHALREAYQSRVDIPGMTVLSVLEAIPREGMAAFTVPSGLTTHKSKEEYRKHALEIAHPELILEHQQSLFRGAPHIVTQVVTFSGAPPSENETPVTRFFSVPDLNEDISTSDVEEEFQRLRSREGGETEFGFVIRGRLDPEEPWTFSGYDPALEEEVEEMELLGQVRPLKELFDVVRSIPPIHEGDTCNKKEEKVKTKEPVSIITGRDIQSDGSVVDTENLSSVDETQVQTDRAIYLQVGDVCLHRITGNRECLPVAVVKEEMLPAVAAHNVLVLRPDHHIKEEGHEVILQYLRSDRAMRYLKAKGSAGNGALLISSMLLEELPVPVPDEDLQSAIQSLTEAADFFETWKNEALSAAQSLFDFPTAQDGRMHVLTTGRRSRQRQKAAERQNDLSYRIHTQFPHPIAYRWRTVAASKPDLEGYLRVLECAEVTTCYLAIMAITLSRAVDCEIGYLQTMRDRIHRGSGTNLGDWISILREVRENKAFQSLPDSAPFYEVMNFMPKDSDVDEALSSLKSHRDNQAHGRGPKGDDVESALKEAKKNLLKLLDAADFLSEYPLRYIERTKADTLQGDITYWYRDVMGDHPLVPVEQETADLETLEAESLYLVGRSGGLYLMRPLLNRQRCPHCGTWSTFYLDSYNEDDHTCTLKSMEHSHTAEDDNIHRAMRKVGLLPD